MRGSRGLRVTAVLVATGVMACGGDGQATSETRSDDSASPTTTASAGSGVDEGDAAHGKELYETKGCPACHTIGGGRLVGPDLAGVAERRDRDWIIAMIVRNRTGS